MIAALPIIGEIVNNVLGIFSKRTDGNNTTNSYQLGSQQGLENYYYSTNNPQCIALNQRINIAVESCAVDGVSGIGGYFFTSLDKERAKCKLQITNDNQSEINRCTQAINDALTTTEIQKQKQKNMQIVGIVTAIVVLLIIIIIFKN
jgi:hypothetical protein